MCKIKRKHPEEVPKESAPMAGMGGHPVIRNMVMEVAVDCELEIRASGSPDTERGTACFYR